MEKNTRSTAAISQKQNRLAITLWRFMGAGLLVSAVVFATLPGEMRAKAATQTNYRVATFNAGSNPSAARVGDLDGDGRNDIAVVNTQGNLQLFFNNGAGSFDRVSLNGLWPPTSNTLDVDIGDLNRDGKNDIAVAFSTQRGAVSVLFNQGSRTFAAPVNYDVCNSSKGVAIGDLDQDGDNDLADISQCSKAGVLVNDGHGSFALRGTYGSGNASKSIVLADFNRDGYKDIAYVNNTVVGTITVISNNRNGTFGSLVSLYAGDLPDDVAVGDFDGNGAADLAIANAYYGLILVLFNEGAGNFVEGYSEIYADTPNSIVSGDFNGDGLTDIATTSQTTSSLSIFLNQGNYNFAGPNTFNVGQAPVDVAAGDFDGDSLPDLVSVNKGSGSITVFFTAGGAPPPPPPPPPITLSVSTQMSKRLRLVELRWSGATGSSVDIYRNGSRLTTASNSGRYTDQFDWRVRGTFVYKVCIAGTQQCSNQATISF